VTSVANVEWLTIAGDAERWRSLGLTVMADGVVPLIGTSLRIVEPGPGTDLGIVGWTLGFRSAESAPKPSTTSIDGLATGIEQVTAPVYASHALGASGLDHLVVLTPDLERTSAAITDATGYELRRVREVGAMRQGFHRIGRGGLIVELVERPDVADGPAVFWGLVLNVDDLDAACDLLGTERVSPPKDAVQPGRRIATMRAEAGLGFPVALMSA
jgi:hypothetical protein